MNTACSTRSSCHTEGMTGENTQNLESNQKDTRSTHVAALDVKKMGRKLGYVRVSDADQTEALQIDALKAAGCDVIYGDHGVSGAVIDGRMGFDTLMRQMREGDTLVVWKLDRLGRSMLHLLEILDDLRQNGMDFIAVTQGIDTTTAIGRMLYGQLAVFAEFEREQIRERTKAGMEAARARGQHLGRPRAIPTDVAIILRERIAAGEASVDQLAEELSVSRQTIVRVVMGRRT